MVSVEGRIALGERIKVTSEANPKRAFPVTVSELEPPRRMVWSGGMPLGLFKGVRTFQLRPASGGITRFEMREEYSGPMLPLIWRSMPDLGPSFEPTPRRCAISSGSLVSQPRRTPIERRQRREGVAR